MTHPGVVGARTAMVLAAGLGLRMRPLTQTVPKPLLKVGGEAMLDQALDRLLEAGVERAVVNTHWLPEKIEQHLKTRKKNDPSICWRISEELMRALLLPNP